MGEHLYNCVGRLLAEVCHERYRDHHHRAGHKPRVGSPPRRLTPWDAILRRVAPIPIYRPPQLPYIQGRPDSHASLDDDLRIHGGTRRQNPRTQCVLWSIEGPGRIFRSNAKLDPLSARVPGGCASHLGLRCRLRHGNLVECSPESLNGTARRSRDRRMYSLEAISQCLHVLMKGR